MDIGLLSDHDYGSSSRIVDLPGKASQVANLLVIFAFAQLEKSYEYSYHTIYLCPHKCNFLLFFVGIYDSNRIEVRGVHHMPHMWVVCMDFLLVSSKINNRPFFDYIKVENKKSGFSWKRSYLVGLIWLN